jgi:hypothetical protein
MKPTSRRPLFYLKIVKCLFFILFFGMFALLMRDVFNKFKSKITSSSISLRSDEVTEKLLPFMTLCAWPIKRAPGFHFTTDDFKRNSFGLEDYIPPYYLPVVRYQILLLSSYNNKLSVVQPIRHSSQVADG